MYKELAKKLFEARQDKSIIEKEILDNKIELTINRKVVSIDKEKNTAVFVMSTSNIDRHGDIVDQDSWILEYFETNPMFFLQHNSHQFPIGKWLKVWFEDDPDNAGKKMLVGEAEFRVKYDDAKRAFNHVVEGDMGAVSVGFIPHRIDYDEDKDAFILYDCELLECSLVGVGSNRQALVKETEKKKEEVKAVDKLIEGRDALNIEIEKNLDESKVISHIKARENLNQAIRRIKSA